MKFKKILCAMISILLIASMFSCSNKSSTSNTDVTSEPGNKVIFYVVWVGKDSFIGSDNKLGNCLVYCDTTGITVNDTRVVLFDDIDITEESGNKTVSNGFIIYNHVIRNASEIRLPEESQGEGYLDKPVIYLYPKTETKVSVKLDLDGKFTCTYPLYNNGWTVTASPDGTLTDQKGKQYYCLYWEGKTNNQYKINKGFVVAGKDTASFLRDKLLYLGLTEREAEEFIIYWLPQMQDNPYNMIYFAEKEYTDSAVLNIDPMPDTLLRIMMVWKPCDEKVDLPEQTLAPTERKGFTVVEWGGCRLGID